VVDPNSKFPAARGRLNGTGPIAVIDIGSNSVRLVVYERQARTPTMLFNEKVLAGLGRGVATDGRLSTSSINLALAALNRFRSLCEHIEVKEVHTIATAAVRDAANGSQFVNEVEDLIGQKVRILNGKEEAYYSARGVMSGFWKPVGVVGDMGGGSLELLGIAGNDFGAGKTFPLGGIRLQEESGGSIAEAQKIAKATLQGFEWPEGEGRKAFYAVGGTWRSLAKLHLFQNGYPLNVMHNYEIPADEAIDFCRMIMQRGMDGMPFSEIISKQRRPLVPFGAVVLERVLREMKAERVLISATGVREGLLQDNLPAEMRAQDPVIEAARELAILRARSPEHAEELIKWTDDVFAEINIDENEEERRLRHAACLLADIGWRAHPDYRGEQSMNIISNAAFVGLDHPGRAYLALSVFYRHQGLIEEALSPRIRELATTRLKDRARILGAVLRVASLISASLPGVLQSASVIKDDEALLLKLPGAKARLDGERLRKRFTQFAKLMGVKGIVLPLP